MNYRQKYREALKKRRKKLQSVVDFNIFFFPPLIIYPQSQLDWSFYFLTFQKKSTKTLVESSRASI